MTDDHNILEELRFDISQYPILVMEHAHLECVDFKHLDMPCETCQFCDPTHEHWDCYFDKHFEDVIL